MTRAIGLQDASSQQRSSELIDRSQKMLCPVSESVSALRKLVCAILDRCYVQMACSQAMKSQKTESMGTLQPGGGHTVDDLLGFLDLAGEKGWFKAGTARDRSSACSRVLGFLEPEARLDVRQLDLEAVVRQFANRNPRVSRDSLNVYRARVASAIKEFLAWNKDRIAWKPRPGRNGSRRTATDVDQAPRSDTELPEGRSGTSSSRRSATEGHSAGPGVAVLSYPFPLRPDIVITINNLPRDLKVAECERVAAFLRSLAHDFTQK